MLLATSWLGTIPGWLTLVALVAVAWVVWRGGGGQAVQILQASNRVLAEKVHELERSRRLDQQQIAMLEARTSLEPMVAAVVEQFGTHEQRAVERHDALLRVVDAMMRRLES